MEQTIAEIEDLVYHGEMPAHNKAVLMQTLARLEEQAKKNPGGFAHQRLISEYGYTADYSEADAGEPPHN